MKKKGDLQFRAFAGDESYHGYALNTAGSPVAHVSISNEPTYDDEGDWDGGDQHKVSWAMANREGATRAGPHMLLAMMKEHYNLDPVADVDLSPHGAKMARSAARRGLIQGHPDNPDMRTSIGDIAGGEDSRNWSMRGAYEDAEHVDAETTKWGEESRMHRFNTGARERAREQLFPKRRKREDPQGRLF
jgi:hypothetical protein